MSIFVTGTDTGVGKTVVATGLALRLGYGYWKPVQTGAIAIANATAGPSAEAEVRDSVGVRTDSQFVSKFLDGDRIFPEVFRLQLPLSPHQAAVAENVRVDVKSIVARQPDVRVVIEGAGGVLVPLNDREFMIDLMEQLRCPIVVVARSTLGTINHTLLTLEALRARSLHRRIAVIVVGEPHPANTRAIEKYGDVPVIAEIPWLNCLSFASLSNAFAQIDTAKMEKVFYA